MTSPILDGVLTTDALSLSPREAARRLGCPAEAVAIADDCLGELMQAVQCRYVFCRRPISRLGSDTLDCGFGPLVSRHLARHLENCSEVFLLAVTLGIGVDRLLLRLSHLSPARHFVTDALASALAEAACDRAEAWITEGCSCRSRFSPGYGDLPLTVQPALLTALDAGHRCGITLGDSLLMSPQKSITALLGILP